MGSRSQRKGAAGERELAALLSAAGYECQRGGSLSFGEIPDVLGLPGIHIEVKRRDSDRMLDGMPALFHRRNRSPWLVTMRLEDWLKLYGSK